MAERLDIDEIEEEKSKSQLKREQLALQALGKELVELPERDLAYIPLSERCLEQVNDGKKMSRGALKRQLGYIGSMMVHEDVTAITDALTALKQQHQGKVREFHQLEMWRDALIADDDNVMSELAVRFAGLDRQHVRQLVRNTHKEAAASKPPKSSRALFQYLSELASNGEG